MQGVGFWAPEVSDFSVKHDGFQDIEFRAM